MREPAYNVFHLSALVEHGLGDASEPRAMPWAIGAFRGGELSGAVTAMRGTGGIYHEKQTEGYLITSGSGTMVTGGHIINGRKSAPNAEVTTTLNGPSCSGQIGGSDVVKRMVKEGDIVIIPSGVPHGWSDIPDHVDYLSFRPSDHILTPGYVHPAIKK